VIVLRYGVLLILLGIVLAMFFGFGGAGGALIDIGKWIVLVVLILYAIVVVAQIVGGPRSPTLP
jgi:hypothetical protein